MFAVPRTHFRPEGERLACLARRLQCVLVLLCGLVPAAAVADVRPASGPAPAEAADEGSGAGGIPQWATDPAGESVVPGNRLELLANAPAYLERRLELIRGARRTVDLLIPIWCPDAGGLAIADALASAARRGVRVRVLADAYNATKLPGEIYSRLRSAGAHLLVYNPPSWGLERVNARMHEKLMVVDGRAAVVGGANLCDEYLREEASRGLWQDLELLAEGPVAAQAQSTMDRTWTHAAREAERVARRYGGFDGRRSARPIGPRVPSFSSPTPVEARHRGDARAVILHQQPYRDDEDTERSLALYEALVASATDRVTVMMPYFVPYPSFKEALLDAVERGVEVRVLTNSRDSMAMGAMFSKAASVRYPRAVSAGVRLYESPERPIHAKAILVDDRLAAVGSHNFTYRSFLHNGEIKLLTDDEGLVKVLGTFLEEKRARFERVDAEELERRGNPIGLLRSLFGRCLGRHF